MSFILDALRKSESERHREALPSVMRMPGPVEPSRLPPWAAGTMAALGLGIVGLGIAWWLSARPARVASAPSAGPPAASLPAPEAAAGTSSPPYAAAQAAAGVKPSAGPISPRSAAPADSRGEHAVPAVAQRQASAGASAGVESSAAADAAARHSIRAADSNALPKVAAFVPGYAEAASQDASMPKLHLDLLAFDPDPAHRFVFIDGQKYLEGETLKQGARLLRITADGAILLFPDGRQYLLGRN